MIKVTIKLLARITAQDQFDVAQTQIVQSDATPIILTPHVPAEFVGRELVLEITPDNAPVRFWIGHRSNLCAWNGKPIRFAYPGGPISFASVGTRPPDPNGAPVQVDAAVETAGS